MEPFIALAIFVGSLISNSIPFIGVPYLLGVGIATSRMNFVDSLIAIILSSLGASIGKIVVYFLGRVFRLRISEETKRNLEVFKKLFRKSIFVAIVIFAATPLPDDVLYIPLGITKYSLPYYFLAVFIGKVVMTAASCLYLGFAARAIESVFKNDVLLGALLSLVLAAITTYLVYVIIKIDWVSVANAWEERGFLEGLKKLFGEVARVSYSILRRLIPKFQDQ